MNPRQRYGWILLTVATLGAVGVFFGVVSYVNDVEAQVGDRVPAYVVTRNVPAYTEIPADALEEVQIPKRWLPSESVTTLSDLTGRVAAAPLSEGTLLQSSNLVQRPGLKAGEREIAIMVNAETGVAGKIRPGDRVDVWATFDEGITAVGPRSKVIAQNMLVMEVGAPQQSEKASANGLLTQNQEVSVTFAAAEGQVKAFTFAATYAAETRLVLRPPLDESEIAPENKTYAETFPQGRGGRG